MAAKVITISPDTMVREIARLLLENRISAAPVVDAAQRVPGIVSEGDLMRRPGNNTERPRSWWLKSFFSSTDSCRDYVKWHGRKADEVMARRPIAIVEDMQLSEIAPLLEKHHVKRVPVPRDGALVGIGSRANLLHGLGGCRT